MTVSTARIAPELRLPLRTQLADALEQYGASGYENKLRRPSWDRAARWYERYVTRDMRAEELQALIRSQARDASNDAANSAPAAVTFTPDRLEALRDELNKTLPAYEDRRGIEHELGEYLGAVVTDPHTDPGTAQAIEELRQRMFLCRVCGHVGSVEADGTRRIAWAHKCGHSRLCPDEAREHVRSEATRYVPAALSWRKLHRRRRIYYTVFSTVNAPRHCLASGIADAVARFRRFLDDTRDCTDEDRARWGYSPRKKKLKVWQPGTHRAENPCRKAYQGEQRGQGEAPTIYADDGLHGALMQLECPLSARGDWNIHLNALLLVQGSFDFAEVRKRWGLNVHMQEVEGDERELGAAMTELIKYAARHVGEKSAEHAERKRLDWRGREVTPGPPLVEWPPAAFAEWWQAQQAARWLRSYGCLHGLPAVTPDAQEVRWIGRIVFTDAGHYSVDLIQGPNFRNSGVERQVPGYRVPQIRPPPQISPSFSAVQASDPFG